MPLRVMGSSTLRSQPVDVQEEPDVTQQMGAPLRRGIGPECTYEGLNPRKAPAQFNTGPQAGSEANEGVWTTFSL